MIPPCVCTNGELVGFVLVCAGFARASRILRTLGIVASRRKGVREVDHGAARNQQAQGKVHRETRSGDGAEASHLQRIERERTPDAGPADGSHHKAANPSHAIRVARQPVYRFTLLAGA